MFRRIREALLRRDTPRSLLSRALRSSLVERALDVLRTPSPGPLGGDRVRDYPDNVIPFPRVSIADKLDAALSEVSDGAERFIGEFEALLTKHGFKQSYIKAVRPVFLEGYMNDDAKPMWFDPDDAGVDVDAGHGN